jgi:hypothetical protein
MTATIISKHLSTHIDPNASESNKYPVVALQIRTSTDRESKHPLTYNDKKQAEYTDESDIVQIGAEHDDRGTLAKTLPSLLLRMKSASVMPPTEAGVIR